MARWTMLSNLDPLVVGAHSPIVFQLMGIRLWARMEEACKLDGFLRDIFEVADDVLRLPVIIGRLHTQPSGGTDSLYACDISHAR